MWQMYAIGENRTNFFINLFNPRVTFAEFNLQMQQNSD